MRIHELPDLKVIKIHAIYVDFILDYIFALGSTANKNQPNQPGHNYAELFSRIAVNKPEILSAFKREPRASILRNYKKLYNAKQWSAKQCNAM